MKKEDIYRGEHYFREGEAFSIVRFPEAVKEEMRPHTHDFVEISYVYSGSGWHSIGSEQFRVSKGDLFLINYDVAHVFYRDAGDDELVTCNLLFMPGFLDESLLPFHDFSSLAVSYLFKNEWDDHSVRADLRLNAEEQRDFDGLIAKMESEYEGREPGYLSIIRAYMIEFIVKMMRGFSRRSEGDDGQPRKAKALEAAIRHLNERYSETVNLVELAQKTFVSKNYFCQLFKDATGKTVSQYTREIRIGEACRQMADSDKTMQQIALEVGYSDYKAFYVAFRKVTGISPHEYKAGASDVRQPYSP